MASKLLGVDIGGTYVKFAEVTMDGEILSHFKERTPSSLEGLYALIQSAFERFSGDLQGVAVSSPGSVTEEGIIEGSSAVPYIHGPNLKKDMEKLFQNPVTIENDANCAALAEYWSGAAAGIGHVAVVVLGTGIGGAVLHHGRIQKGAHLHGGEFGYMIINGENLGNGLNTFSEAASTSSLVRKVAAHQGVETSSITGEQVFQMAEDGDAFCMKVIDEFYTMLAVGIHNIQYAHDPEVILIGGGISARHELVANVEEKLSGLRHSIEEAQLVPNLGICRYGAHANIVGAVYHFKTRMNGADKI
ncbi:ROK family protein [Halobacillus kuroshimensis]|uniref:ROK family protein n=1 Tax=Halobacillus kuroshimensis TaxID=302481 RepID=A0ABS3DYL1_9BACI|nr:ROK family protein [Halobacillus kuroshimensis]MBN8236406.1 ROK family protein [Halobacillus kuroshimensis]